MERPKRVPTRVGGRVALLRDRRGAFKKAYLGVWRVGLHSCATVYFVSDLAGAEAML
jgi:hypothetical protein